jgi:hypothetical protein
MAKATVAKKSAVARKPAKRSADEQFAEQMYRKIMRAPALFTKEEADRAERTANLRDWVRRATWHFLAMPGKEMIQRCRTDRDFAVALAGMDQHTEPYIDNLKGIIGFVEALQARTLIALACREDMADVIAEAQKSGEGPGITIDNVHELLRKHEAGSAA